VVIRGRSPDLRLPQFGPLVRAALFYDFVPPDFDPDVVDWDGEPSVIIDQRLAAIAQRMIRDLGIHPPALVTSVVTRK
jgi:hypothetical protein